MDLSDHNMSRVFNFVKNIFDTKPVHYSEGINEDGHFTISRKRPGDVQIGETSSPQPTSLETGIERKESHPLQALPIDSAYFVKPDLRTTYHTIPRKSKPSTKYSKTDSMDFKGRGAAAGFSPLRNPNHGEENAVIEISDEDDDGYQHHVNARSSTRSRDVWVDAVPKPNPSSKSFQRPCYKLKDNNTFEDDNLPSKTSDFVAGPLQWAPSSEFQNRFGNRKLAHRPKLIDNKQYTPLSLPPSAMRDIEETIRLEEKNNYSQLLKHYETLNSEGKRPSNGLHYPRPSRLAGIFDSQATTPLVVSHSKTKGITEYIDITARMKERGPKVRRDQEVKPQTLASKIANAPIETAITSGPIPQVSRMNSLEKILKLNTYCKPMFLEDTLKMVEEQKLETQKSLQEPKLRAERYARQNEYDKKLIEDRMRRHIKIIEADVILDEVLEEGMTVRANKK